MSTFVDKILKHYNKKYSTISENKYDKYHFCLGQLNQIFTEVKSILILGLVYDIIILKLK